MFPCALPVPSFLDSYHGTLQSSFQLSALSCQLSAVSFQLLGESLSAFDLNFCPGTPLQLCRELRQVFRSQTFFRRKTLYVGTAALGCPASVARALKLSPLPAISRCVPADFDRFPIPSPSPAS